MTIRDVSTSRLREYKNNPRNNDLAVEKVKYSIERFGFLFPVVIDMNYTIVWTYVNTLDKESRKIMLFF